MFIPFADSKYGHEIPDETVSGIAGGVAAPFYGARQKMTEIVVDKLNQISQYYPAETDFYVIMPNHLHLIVYIKEDKKVSLALIIKAFKSWTTMGAKNVAAEFYSAQTQKRQHKVLQLQRNQTFLVPSGSPTTTNTSSAAKVA